MKTKGIIALVVLIVAIAIALIFTLGGNKKNTMPETNDFTVTIDATMNEATIGTPMGDIVLELYGEQTPKTVENFAKLASEGFYNGTRFHRVISGFMIQGGDPLSADLEMKGSWGTGGPDYRFDDEIVEGLSNLPGTISMANAGPGTNGSQFFINVADNSFLDGKHTVFGKVTQGYDLVEAIAVLPTNERDQIQ